MKLYINIKKMNFEEDNIEHNIISSMSDKEFYGYDVSIELPNDDKFIQDTLKIKYKKDKNDKDTKEIENKMFKIREDKTWWSFPLYEIIDNKIVPFNYKNYQYFMNTDRRIALASKINKIYNKSSETKILRKTFKYIMDNLEIPYPDFFGKYNKKVEEVINKSPKK